MLALVSCSGNQEPADFVNVFNGTGFAGNTYPGATTPFGAVQLSPDTDAGLCSGYHYSHSTILGFSHTHLSGTGCPDLGDFLVTPGIDSTVTFSFSHENETASPGYYKVVFPDKGITAELTAMPHTGVHRYTFSGSGTPMVRIDANHCQGGWCTPSNVVLKADGQEIEGSRQVTGWANDRDVYMSAAFSVPFTEAVEVEPGVLVISFAPEVKDVTLYAGISGVSLEGAKANRLEEAKDRSFDELRLIARQSWDKALASIEVKGGPADLFYTSFYHTFVTPNMIDDVDGSYRDQNGQDRKLSSGSHFYSTMSIWDTFRTWNPLQTILDPDLVNDIVRSMLDDYDCNGQLPIWPLGSDDTGCMIGYHNVSIIADAWLHGIRGFDGEKALEAMIVSSNRNNANASELYNEHGYIPADLKIESVSQTLEFCYDDWCIARMAESLGHEDIAAEYYDRSLRYRALFDPVTGFMRGKKVDGNWTEPFDQLSGSRDYTEATPWHYRFFMPHDMAGMESLLGGKEALLSALDSLFTYVPENQEVLDAGISGNIGQYAHGNEPSHNMAYLFNWVGAPYRTQELVRRILTELYSTEPGGISGNEDCGQMSAWYVMSALGLYPVCPGSGEYQLVAPLFSESTIHLGNGNTLVIKADHPSRTYISDVTLNGEPVREHFLTYEQIMAGGELSFRLSSKPDHVRDGLPVPYSLTRTVVASTPAILGDLIRFPESTDVTLVSRNEGATIRYTLDGSEPTEESTLYTGPFTIDDTHLVKARAYCEGMQPSPVASRTAYKLHFLPPAKVSGLKQGCHFTYHVGPFQLASEVEASQPKDSGTMEEPSIDGAPDEDHFGYVFTGYIDIREDGIWSFTTRSDDGSVLYIDGQCVVNSDGSHSAVDVYGDIPLQKGLHPYKLVYLEDYEGQELSWGWKAPGAEKHSAIPASSLFYR